MKKLMVAMIGAAAAFGASALDVGARFEDAALGTNTVAELNTAAGGTYWGEGAGGAISNAYVVKAMAGSYSGERPAYFDDMTAPTKQLDVHTAFGNPLEFYANAGSSTNVGTGIYFDSLVKFTVCEEAPATNLYDNAKIVMWLQEQYNANNDPIGTNLMVKAGFLSFNENVAVTDAVYTCGSVGGTFADAWHRVTIKALADITAGGDGVPGFAIYIDRDLVAAPDVDKWDNTFVAELSEAAAFLHGVNGTRGALFPSMVQSGVYKTTVTLAAFDGTGVLNDVTFTDTAPDFAKDYVEPKVALTIGDEVIPNCDTIADAIKAIADAAPSSEVTAIVTLQKDFALTAPIEVAARSENITQIVIDFAGKTITSDLDVAAITNNALSLTFLDETGLGGITCTGEGEAVYALNGDLYIYGGNFDGNIEVDEDWLGEFEISGGSFKQSDLDLGEYLADGKTMVENQETGLYDVVTAFTVNFVNGELIIDQQVVATNGYAVLPAAPAAPTGYTFAGWTPSVDDPIVSNTTFTATFAGKTFTINVYTNGVDCGVSTSFVYSTGMEVVVPAPAFDSETETWNSEFYATAEALAAFAFDPSGALTQVAYTVIEASSSPVTPIDPDQGGTVDYDDAATATAAANTMNNDKDTYIPAPATVSDAATYHTYVEAVASGTAVSIQLTTAGKAVAQASANADVVALGDGLTDAAASSAGGTASVSTVAGLYYSVLSGTTPDAVTTEGARVLGTGGSVNLTLPNKGVKGFYKVKVSATK